MTKYTHRTRSGLPARIVCTDRAGAIPVLALVLEKNGVEHIIMMSSSSRFSDDGKDHPLDLFEAQPWELERPDPRVVKVGEKLRVCLFTARARNRMGGLDACQSFDLSDSPDEFHDLIKAFVDEKLSAVEATYIAMRRAEVEDAGQ